jgi:hypothetical protein
MQEPKNYFITENEMWDSWWQKLFAQLISVKLWVIALITYLLIDGKIDGGHYVALLTVIMGLKGVFAVADVWKNNGTTNVMEKV